MTLRGYTRAMTWLIFLALFFGTVCLASGRAQTPRPGQAQAEQRGSNGTADLQVSKQMIVPSEAAFAPDSQVEYAIVLRHNGPDLATNVVLEDTLPEGVSFREASPGCTRTTQGPPQDVVRCEWASLPVWPVETTVWLQVALPAEACGWMTNTVRVYSDSPDPNPANNIATLENEVRPCGPLPVRVSQSLLSPASGAVHSGDTVTFEIVVANLSGTSLTRVALEGSYDSSHLQFLYASHEAETWTSPPLGLLVWEDLTCPAPRGFGGPLLPLQSFRVQTYFRAIETGFAWICGQGAAQGEGIDILHSDCDSFIIAGSETPTPTPSPTGAAGQHSLYLPLMIRRQSGGPGLIFADNFDHDTMAGWTPSYGTWSNRNDSLRGEFVIGQAWNLYNASGSNFVYEGAVTLIDASAAGLTIRSTANGLQSYDIMLDAVGKAFKISKHAGQPQAQVLANYPLNVERGRPYHIKVVANFGTIEGYLEGARVLVANDGTYLSGRFGVTVYLGSATFDDLRASSAP
jgi:uncharacterized repeat protein (TIGR01451 family)